MRNRHIFSHGCHNAAAHIQARNQAYSRCSNIRANHHDCRSIPRRKSRRKFAKELLLVGSKVDDHFHKFVRQIAAFEFTVRPVLVHIIVHDFQELIVSDSCIAGRMHSTNLVVTVLNLYRTFPFCQDKVQDLFQALAAFFAKQFVAVHANHASVANAADCTVPYRLLADTGGQIQPCVLLRIKDRFFAHFHLLGVFIRTKRFIMTRFKTNVTNPLLKPFSICCVLLALCKQLVVLASLVLCFCPIQCEIHKVGVL